MTTTSIYYYDTYIEFIRIINSKAYRAKVNVDESTTYYEIKRLIQLYCEALDDESFKRLCSDVIQRRRLEFP